jgi:hypothetical protein
VERSEFEKTAARLERYAAEHPQAYKRRVIVLLPWVTPLSLRSQRFPWR